jgi:hypothetical protein
MTQQYTGGNSAVISMSRAASVPIVSKTENDAIKATLSLVFALAATAALAEPLPVPFGSVGWPAPFRLP